MITLHLGPIGRPTALSPNPHDEAVIIKCQNQDSNPRCADQKHRRSMTRHKCLTKISCAVCLAVS